MNTEEFYAQFGTENNLPSIYKRKAELTEEIRLLEEKIKTQSRIEDILSGLKTTPKQEDPGKSERAYYFVKEIKENNITPSDEPSLNQDCPNCKKKQPILMWYGQTEDSPEGDTWVKEAFIICCEKVHAIKSFARDYRF